LTGSGAAYFLLLDAMPLLGVAVAILAWLAFLGRISRKALGVAWVLLLGPYVLLFAMDPTSGLEIAFREGASTLVSPLAGIALAIATVRHRRMSS
jgi:uncharacterized membrane protein